MGSRLGLGTRLWTGGIAAGGILAGHLLTYRALVHDDHARLGVLERTGHVYWPWVVGVGVGLVVASVGGLLVAAGRDRGPRFDGRTVARRLMVPQCVLWLVLEMVERGLLAHHGTPLLDRFVLLGLIPQVLAALLITVSLAALSRAVRRLFSGSNRRGVSASPFVPRLAAQARRPPRAIPRGARWLRAPPLPAS